MRAFLSILALVLLAVFLQLTVVSRINLLSGSADLVLIFLAAMSLQERVRHMLLWGAAVGLLVGGISAAPWYLCVGAYLTVVGLGRLLARRIWQAPLLALLVVTMGGTLILQGSIFVYRALFETALSLSEVFSQVVLPSLFLNFLIAVVLHPLIRDLGDRLYPLEA